MKEALLISQNPLDEHFMEEAIKEAKLALAADEVPIGAVITHGGKIIAHGHNQCQRLGDVTLHAEMIAITAAANYLGSKYLKDCTLYVTIEPCVMCAGALFWTQISRVVFGAYADKRGFTLVSAGLLHPQTTYTGSVLAPICARLVQDFFRQKR